LDKLKHNFSALPATGPVSPGDAKMEFILHGDWRDGDGAQAPTWEIVPQNNFT
jgi:hypothetical protein